jgi:PQQ-dependent catabolism-associated CXXCW motif protein
MWDSLGPLPQLDLTLRIFLSAVGSLSEQIARLTNANIYRLLETMMLQALSLIFASFFSSIVFGQVQFPVLPTPVSTFSAEDKDWRVEPSTTPKRGSTHAPTPTSIPGARVIKTMELEALLETNNRVIVVDVLDSSSRRTVPGAFWMLGAGDSRFYGDEKSRFSAALAQLTAGDKKRPLVFMCKSSECWLSYNASLYALEAGYTDVIWYRGGSDAWRSANLGLKTPKTVSW